MNRGPRRPFARSGGLVLGLGVAGLLLLCSPAPAQYLNAYKAGLDAIDAKDWKGAAASMTEAIADRGEEKLKLPVRLFLRPYVPHLYLGQARFESGDCAGALAAWAESERQGVAPKLPEFDLARRGRKECSERARKVALVEARQSARQSLARSQANAAALLERAQDPRAREHWSAGDPSPLERHQRAVAQLDQASALLAEESVDAAGVERAEAAIREADGVLAAIGPDLDSAAEAKRRDLAATDQGIETRVAAAREALAATAYLAPYPRLLRKARADLEGLVAEAARRDAASKARLEGLAARLDNSIEVLTKLATPPSDSLEKAARAYLEGGFESAIETLAGARFADRRARAHARLLLAASRHALYLEGGELDRELLQAAVDDARACRQEDEQLAPIARFFSPRFIAFFEQSTAPVAAPSG